MTDDQPSATPPGPPGQSGCAPLLGLLGFILMVPGVCTVLFAIALGSNSEVSVKDIVALLLFIGLPALVLFGVGVWLYRKSLRRPAG